MEKIENIIFYIMDKYKKEFSMKMDEMKMHKLLYFIQRESLVRTNEPLFKNVFYGWRYGPVLVDARKIYESNKKTIDYKISESSKKIVDDVFIRYAAKSSWNLSILSHGEYSWKESRKGIPYNENGSNPIKLNDIRKDADEIRLRRIKLREQQINN